MIEELLEASTDSFHALDRIFARRTLEWAEPLGITQQSIDEARERLVRDREDSLDGPLWGPSDAWEIRQPNIEVQNQYKISPSASP